MCVCVRECVCVCVCERECVCVRGQGSGLRGDALALDGCDTQARRRRFRGQNLHNVPRLFSPLFFGKTPRFADVLVQTFGRAGTELGRDGLRWVVLWWPLEQVMSLSLARALMAQFGWRNERRAALLFVEPAGARICP